MDKIRIFGYLENGAIEILSYSNKYFDQCVIVLESFFANASICIGLEMNLPESGQARAELASLCQVMAEDGVSLMARDVKLDKIIGVAFNKIQVKRNPNEESAYFAHRTKNTRSENGKALLEMMMELDQAFDCYNYFETDCIFDLSFLSTLIPGYEKKSIGKMLVLYSMQLSEELANGESMELLPTSLRHCRPGAITAAFSSDYSQKIGRDLGFETLHEVFFTDLKYNGKSVADRITAGGHSSMCVAGKKFQEKKKSANAAGKNTCSF